MLHSLRDLAIGTSIGLAIAAAIFGLLGLWWLWRARRSMAVLAIVMLAVVLVAGVIGFRRYFGEPTTCRSGNKPFNSRDIGTNTTLSAALESGLIRQCQTASGHVGYEWKY